MFSQRDVTVKEIQHQERLQQAEKARLIEEITSDHKAASWSIGQLMFYKKEQSQQCSEQNRLAGETA